MLKNGSCATRGCESCQVGNQAALSGLSGVPRGSLFGADVAATVCKCMLEVEVYGSIRPTEFYKTARMRSDLYCVPRRVFLLFGFFVEIFRCLSARAFEHRFSEVKKYVGLQSALP